MKTKGRRQSSNVQDQRGPTAAYGNRPSTLKAAADNRKNQAFWDGKYATAGNGKMAQAAGAGGVKKAADQIIKKQVLKEISASTKKGKK